MTASNPQKISWPDLFGPQGFLSKGNKGIDVRPQQADMAEAVQKALDQGKHLMVEAGTGVGKSLAYLLPCAFWAVRNDKRVVVSTFTKALQEQLLEKDLPLVRAVLKRMGMELRTALLMGAENYLCLDRLHRALAAAPDFFDSPPPDSLLKKLLEGCAGAGTALRAKLPGPVPGPVWEKICRDSDLCLARGGPLEEACLYKKDLARARRAHVLVVNHHLFFAGLPVDKIHAVVFDEAHTLEDVAAGFLGFSVTNRGLKRLSDDIHNPETGRGLVRRLSRLDFRWRGHLDKALEAFRMESEAFFNGLANHLGLNEKEPARRLRSPLPAPDPLSGPLSNLEALLTEALSVSASAEEEAEVRSLRDRVRENQKQVRTFFERARPTQALWAERAATRRGLLLSLHMAPVDVSGPLRQRLFQTYSPVILTSATLAVGGSFQTARERIGLEENLEALLDSPFDYAERTALYLPPVPDPKEDPLGHEKAVLEQCLRLARIVPGGMFVLFTNWSFLERAHAAFKKDLTDRLLFKQGEQTPYALTEKFKKAGNGVLLGTDTFWQGVDVPGRALCCVVITRLPFAVPTNPLEEARQEWLASQGKDIFNQYSLPRAVIKFRQGFGRLIRTRTDFGAVALLDPRASTKPYGRIFLQSLPQCRRMQTPEDLAAFFQKMEDVPPPSRTPASAPADLRQEEAILALVREWNSRLPRSAAANVLRGARASDVFQRHPPETFGLHHGALKGMDYHKLVALIDGMIQRGLLRIENKKLSAEDGHRTSGTLSI